MAAVEASSVRVEVRAESVVLDGSARPVHDFILAAAASESDGAIARGDAAVPATTTCPLPGAPSVLLPLRIATRLRSGPYRPLCLARPADGPLDAAAGQLHASSACAVFARFPSQDGAHRLHALACSGLVVFARRPPATIHQRGRHEQRLGDERVVWPGRCSAIRAHACAFVPQSVMAKTRTAHSGYVFAGPQFVCEELRFVPADAESGDAPARQHCFFASAASALSRNAGAADCQWAVHALWAVSASSCWPCAIANGLALHVGSHVGVWFRHVHQHERADFTAEPASQSHVRQFERHERRRRRQRLSMGQRRWCWRRRPRSW